MRTCPKCQSTLSVVSFMVKSVCKNCGWNPDKTSSFIQKLLIAVVFAVSQFFIADLKFGLLVRVGLGALMGALVVALWKAVLLISQGKDQKRF